MDDFVNHSCNPNCYVRYGDFALIALRDINKGEELSYNYCTTEEDLEQFSFPCSCGAETCIKEVRGFRYLSLEQKKQIQTHLFPYLAEKIEEETQLILVQVHSRNKKT